MKNGGSPPGPPSELNHSSDHQASRHLILSHSIALSSRPELALPEGKGERSGGTCCSSAAPKLQPRSGDRMQPTACPEPVEGAQAVGSRAENEQAPEGRKRSYDTPKNSSTLRTYTSAKSATARRPSIKCIASSSVHPIDPNSAKAIIGARCTPAAQWINTFASLPSSAASAKSTPRRNNSAGFASKSSSVGFHSTSMPCSNPNSVSSNSICMSMMCVIPARATFAMLSEFQIPPPTAIRSVNHVISIPVLYDFFGVPPTCRVLRDRACRERAEGVGILTSDFSATQTDTAATLRAGRPISRVLCEKACPEPVEGWGFLLSISRRTARLILRYRSRRHGDFHQFSNRRRILAPVHRFRITSFLFGALHNDLFGNRRLHFVVLFIPRDRLLWKVQPAQQCLRQAVFVRRRLTPVRRCRIDLRHLKQIL